MSLGKSRWFTLYKVLGLLCLTINVSAQSNSNLHCKSVPNRLLMANNPYSLQDLDSINIIDPNSVTIDGETKISVDSNGVLEFDKLDAFKIREHNTNICYRTLSVDFNKTIKLYDVTKNDTGQVFAPPRQDIEVREELFASPGIEKSGVISRGISFGNQQDVFVNSNLNLQMHGDLGDGIRLNAVISDQNIPFQPEGNTQQIQEFDQIFIDLNHDRWNLKAGDILLQKNNSLYMKYFKKVQGVKVDLKSKDKSKGNHTFAAASIAKGKFNSMLVNAIEGVQGPYRLSGINGEQFIIVIANTEKVFLDGKELIRGFDYDYTIDYNTSEITFTNQLVITKFSRIRVDFEYTERNYARSVYNFGHQYKSDKLSLGFEFFNEQDNKRQYLQGELPPSQQQFMEAIGDSLQNAIFPSDRLTTEEDIGRITYVKLDTLGEQIFKYKPNIGENEESYVVEFSEVTEGRGAYVQEITTVNGRIYSWVGNGNGNYIPFTVIPAPNKRQMSMVNMEYKLGKRSSIYSEIALSNKDVNLFSELDDRDDSGLAFQIGSKQDKLKIGTNKQLSVNTNYQFQGERFNSLDRIRYADFERDWNSNSTQKATEHLLGSNFIINDSTGKILDYKISFRNKDQFFTGLQNDFKSNVILTNWLRLKTDVFTMDNASSSQTAQWRRIYFNPEWDLSTGLRQGYKFNLDKNKVVKGDSVQTPLMNYDEHVMYISAGDTSSGHLNIEHRIRQDYLPVDNDLKFFGEEWNDKSNTSSLSYSGKIGEHQRLGLTASVRDLLTKTVDNPDGERERNLLGRLDWNLNALKRSVQSKLVYTMNTSRELIRELRYIPVLQSQGTHVWIDYNEDGVKDLDEFQQVVEGVNVGADTLYAKFFFPTNDYVKAFTHNMNYRFNLRPPRKWAKKGNLKKLLSKFSNTSYLLIDKKTTNNSLNDRINPFSSSLNFDSENEDVLSLRRNIRSTLFFNRTNPKYALDLTRNTQGGKQLLTYGQDGRYLEEWRMNTRWLLFQQLTLKTSSNVFTKNSKSTYLNTRVYDIDGIENDVNVALQQSNKLRFSVGYVRSDKKGFSELFSPTLKSNEFNFETKVRQVSNRSITANFRYVRMNFQSSVEGSENSPLAYDLLQALRPGNNLLWKFNIQQRLSNGLNLVFIYEGRKSDQQPIVHTGNMQVSALF